MNSISLGPFHLRELVGRGAAAEVWSAHHPGADLDVAVKILRVDDDDTTGSAMRREVRAVARLDHPAIAEVLDYGSTSEEAELASDGALRAHSPWYAMELGEKGTLSRHIGTMQWAELQSALLLVLDGLAHAHARGVIHRDLKPANVVLGTRRSKLALVDFGIAQVLRGSDDDWLSGTPAYMAPEQVEGQWRDQGPATDLYALGCLAWTMSCGVPPFVGPAPTVLQGHLMRPLPPYDPAMAVPTGFEQWLRILLAKLTRERFDCASRAAGALRGLSSSAPQLAKAGKPPIPTSWRDAGAGSKTIGTALGGWSRALQSARRATGRS